VGFDRLAADDPAALDLLTLIAWCAPEPVPLIMLTEHPEVLPDRLSQTAADPLAFARRTRLLHRSGMAAVARHSAQVHRVPAALLRARTRTAPETWPAVLVRLLRAALPGDVWNNPTVWALWQPLLPHVLGAVTEDRPLDDVAREVSWLLDRAGRYLHSRGQARTALPLLRRAHTLNRDHLGEDHPDTLHSANNLASGWRALGKYQQARILHEDTLTRRRRVLGEDHRATLGSAYSLARDLRALGDYRQARTLNEDTLARYPRVLGEDHPATLTSANNLALDLHALGDYQQARTLNEDTLTRRRQVLGEDHLDTLTSANNLALDLHALGDHHQARTLNEDTLTRRRRVLGEDHPDTRQSAANLAEMLRKVGEAPQ
jgi:tetratricopeptide (TPR) repeat protein